MKRILVCLLLIFPLFLTNASATLYEIPAVSTEKVSGADMAGMDVTITLADGRKLNDLWTVLSASGGGVEFDVSGNQSVDVSLTYDYSDTWPWPLVWAWELDSSYAISSFTIDAYASNILFDIVAYHDYVDNPVEYSLNSEDGWFSDMPSNTTPYHDKDPYLSPTWAANAADDLTVSFVFDGWEWTFSDPVKVAGQSYMGDLFGTLTATATDQNNGNVGTTSFLLDTDAVGAVPEPATMLLLGVGLLGLAGITRKKNI